MSFPIEWQKQKNIFGRVKITEGAFTISGVYDIAAIHLVRWSDLWISILKARIYVHQGIRFVEVVPIKEVFVDGVQHLGHIDFVGLVLYIQLCWIQKTKQKVKKSYFDG